MNVYLFITGRQTQDSWETYGDLNRLENQEQKNTKKILFLEN